MKLLETGDVLPQNLDAERFVLASLLANNNDVFTPTILCETLQESDFTTVAHKQVFLTAQTLVRAGKSADMVTVADALVRGKAPVQISDVVGLDSGIPTLANLEGWIEIVREKARLREVIPYLSQLLGEAYSGTESNELIARAAQMGEKMAAMSVGRGSLRSLDEIIQERGIDEILKPANHAGIETPIPWLSRQMRFVPKEFTILAARPSEGKSAFALQCAVEAARRRYRVAFYSLEMANEKNASRLISQESEVNMARIRSGEAEPDEWAMIRESVTRDDFDVIKKHLLFCDRGLVTIPHIMADLQAATMSGDPIQFLIIDYLQLMTGVGKFENRTQEVSSISRGCKLISQNFNIPLLALSQFRRENEKESRPPRLSDLKESGSLEQDATNVLALHRKSDFNDPIWNTDLLALKLRDNATDKCMLNFIRRYTKFVEAVAA